MLKKIVIVLASLVVLYYLAFGALYIAGYRWYLFPTTSMEPTITKNEHVIGRLSEGYRDHINRFDIVVYRLQEASGQIYSKRVIGLPGERVRIDGTGVFVNESKLVLPESVKKEGLGVKKCDVVVSNDAVFVLGDNTLNSADSRYFGPVPKQNVIGKIVFRK